MSHDLYFADHVQILRFAVDTEYICNMYIQNIYTQITFHSLLLLSLSLDEREGLTYISMKQSNLLLLYEGSD